MLDPHSLNQILERSSQESVQANRHLLNQLVTHLCLPDFDSQDRSLYLYPLLIEGVREKVKAVTRPQLHLDLVLTFQYLSLNAESQLLQHKLMHFLVCPLHPQQHHWETVDPNSEESVKAALEAERMWIPKWAGNLPSGQCLYKEDRFWKERAAARTRVAGRPHLFKLELCSLWRTSVSIRQVGLGKIPTSASQ